MIAASSVSTMLFVLDCIVLIEVNSGNEGMTFEESKSHFTAWALMKSPLVIVS